MFKFQIFSVGSGGCGMLLLNNLDDFNTPQLVQLIDCQDQNQKIKFSGLIGLIKKQETIYYYGQFTQIISIPKQIDNIKKVIKFACGWQHGLILTDDGLYGLGSNKFYEFGFKEKNIYEQPQKLLFDQNSIIDITCGFRQSFIIRKEDIYVVGQNKFNELNVPDQKVIEQFTKINISEVKKIKCGQKFTLLQKIDDSLWGWGCNNFGQLAQKPEVQIVQSKQLFQSIKSFDCGWSHHIIQTKDQQIYICGRGDLGQQGDGQKANNFNYQEIKIKGTQIKCGSESTLILNEEHKILYVTGWNEHGNLGLGHNQNIYSFQNLDKIQYVKAKGASMLLFI